MPITPSLDHLLLRGAKIVQLLTPSWNTAWTKISNAGQTNYHVHTDASDVLSRTSHIFDGRTLTKETAAFQLCDIEDPMLKEMIQDTNDLRETCDVGVSMLFFILHAYQQANTRSVTDGIRHTYSSASRPCFGINSSPCSMGILRRTKNVATCSQLIKVQLARLLRRLGMQSCALGNTIWRREL